ncbi:MAG TPA: RNA-binding protein [Bradyrhizobium sp.]|nr:RNA-binding protein [Bradyrhizobium sp.]
MLAMADPELDNGPRTEKSATTRMCAVSRDVRPIEELIRFVVGPSGDVVPDIKRKLPGRGLWIAASRQAVAEAVRRHHFSRGFKANVRAAPTLADEVETLLVRSTVEALGIAAKAGQVVSGFAKVESALQQQGRFPLAALIHASDGAADGIRKLDALARQIQGSKGPAAPALPIVTCLTSAELDLALGRANVIHAALLAGPASRTLLSRIQTLVRYRLADADKTAGTAAKNSDEHSEEHSKLNSTT